MHMVAAGREILPARSVFTVARYEPVVRRNYLTSLMMPGVEATLLRLSTPSTVRSQMRAGPTRRLLETSAHRSAFRAYRRPGWQMRTPRP